MIPSTNNFAESTSERQVQWRRQEEVLFPCGCYVAITDGSNAPPDEAAYSSYLVRPCPDHVEPFAKVVRSTGAVVHIDGHYAAFAVMHV